MDLGDIDLSKVSEILSTLSDEDVEKLNGMAAEMFGSDAFGAGNKSEKQSGDKGKGNSFPFGDMPFDGESMAKIMNDKEKNVCYNKNKQITFLQIFR